MSSVSISRGAESIDRNLRIIGESWWLEEEIPYPEGPYALNLYCETKPQIVLTHDCPTSILPHVLRGPYKGRNSRTNELLQQMFDMHQPALWFFGHHHRSVTTSVHGTTFRCLDELETYDLLADA